MAGAGQHAAVLGIEGVDVAGAAEPLGTRIGVGHGAHGGRTVVGRNTGGAPFEQVDGDGEGGAEHGRVALHLVLQAELAAALFGKRSAQHAAAVAEHVVDFFGSDEFGGGDEVAFVFAVFIIDHNHELPLTEVFEGLFYGGELELFHNAMFLLEV